MIIAFTGHRSDKLGGYENKIAHGLLKQATREALCKLPVSLAYCGMAIGFDQIAAEACIELGIPFIAAVPFVGQEGKWPKSTQDYYQQLLKHAQEIVIVSEGGYAAWKMQVRNTWMVDRCDVLIACFDGTAGGTKNTFDYANKQYKKIIRLDPIEILRGL